MRLSLFLAGLFLALSLAGCARQQMKFDSLGKRDKLRFAACRHDVARYICPDDPDCDIRAAEMYANESPDARLQWLLDYKCPREKIQHADKRVKEQEHRSIGMEPKE
jgi:hypothetical protein